jgi:hypothetical protein
MPYFNWNDTINLFSKLTIRRAWNAARVMASYQLSKLTGKPVQWGYPVSISFEPTTSCNLRCPECPSGLREFSRPTGMLKKIFSGKPLMIFIRRCYTLSFISRESLT